MKVGCRAKRKIGGGEGGKEGGRKEICPELGSHASQSLLAQVLGPPEDWPGSAWGKVVVEEGKAAASHIADLEGKARRSSRGSKGLLGTGQQQGGGEGKGRQPAELSIHGYLPGEGDPGGTSVSDGAQQIQAEALLHMHPCAYR